MLKTQKILTIGMVLAAATFLFSDRAQACGEGKTTAAVVKNIDSNALAMQLNTTQVKPVVVDVNSPSTRSKMGTIPGAVLLTSASRYEVAKELPQDKSAPLVFYCANTMCGASKTAAKRALEAGFTNVAVLPEGIAGWRQAGMPTETPRI